MPKQKRRKTKKVKKTGAKSKLKTRAVNFLVPEFVYYKKGLGWYIVSGIIGLGLIGAAVWQRQWFLAVIILLAIIVFFQYSKKRPQSKKCHIGKDGIKIDQKTFPPNLFKSFSIIYDRPVSHLFLETSKRFYPSFWLHVKNKDLARVKKALLGVLPEKQTQEGMIVRINRWFRF